MDGVKLMFDDDALIAIAKKALERKTGARGLRAIMEDVIMDLMYEIPSQTDVSECLITKDVVEGKAKTNDRTFWSEGESRSAQRNG